MNIDEIIQGYEKLNRGYRYVEYGYAFVILLWIVAGVLLALA